MSFTSVIETSIMGQLDPAVHGRGAKGFVVRVGGVRASWEGTMSLWMRVVLMTRTSNVRCPFVRVDDTMLFGV